MEDGPANVIHDGSDEVTNLFPDSNSARICNSNNPKHGSKHIRSSYGFDDDSESFDYRDSGSASRFFYSAKASGKDRIYTCTKCNESIFKSDFDKHKHGETKLNHIITHPTCKPLSLMKYLVKLITPPNGTVLDPFSGSGTTLQAAVEEGFNCIGIEREDEYIKNIQFRMKNIEKPKKTLF